MNGSVVAKDLAQALEAELKEKTTNLVRTNTMLGSWHVCMSVCDADAWGCFGWSNAMHEWRVQMEELAAAQKEAASNKEESELEALRTRVEGMAAEQKRTLEGHVAELTREWVDWAG